MIWSINFVLQQQIIITKKVDLTTREFNSFIILDQIKVICLIMMRKTPPESVQWFQGCEQLKDSQNNRIEIHCISQSMLPTSD